VNISSITTPQSSSPQSAIQRWPLIASVGDLPRRVFRQALHLPFHPASNADHITIATALLQATFEALDYNALQPPAPLAPAQRVALGDAVKVTLAQPQQILQVTLANTLALPPGTLLELYRLDGPTLASQPTVTVPLQNHTATFNAEFIDRQFALRLKPPVTPLGLTPANLTSLQVRSYPTAPRIGLAALATPLDPLWFWQPPGEFKSPIDLTPADQAAFKTALDRYFTNLTPPLPTLVEVALVLEADAPCQVNLTAFNLVYHLRRTTFPVTPPQTTAPEKQVLRFTGDRTPQRLSLTLPSHAHVTAASLQVVESFRPDRPLPPTPSGPPNSPIDPVPALLAQTTGIPLSDQRWGAQPLTPIAAMTVTGIAVGVLALTANTQLQVEIQADWQGQPAGHSLVAGPLTLLAVGQAQYVTLLLPEPIDLDTQPYWLLVKATQGSAVWLVQPGDSPAQLLENPPPSGIGTTLQRFGGVSALYQLLARPVVGVAGETGETAPATATAALTIAIANTPITAPPADSPDTRIYDLTAALNQQLATASGESTGVTLTFTAGVPGIATVYPPQVEFDRVSS
jgi:hypothetical protein